MRRPEAASGGQRLNAPELDVSDLENRRGEEKDGGPALPCGGMF